MDHQLYIFDVDGTLVKTKSGKDFRQTADDWEWLPGRIEACKKLVEAGKSIAIATNQGGVAFTWSSFTASAIQAEIEVVACTISAGYIGICFNVPNIKAMSVYYHENDPRRKPNAGMLKEAMKYFEINPEETVMIGDREEDEQTAENADVAFIHADIFFK